MTTIAAFSIQVDSAPDFPGVSFGRSGDGMVTALVHETRLRHGSGERRQALSRHGMERSAADGGMDAERLIRSFR